MVVCCMLGRCIICYGGVLRVSAVYCAPQRNDVTNKYVNI